MERNAVYSVKKEDVEKFLEIAEADGIMWPSGKKPTKYNPWAEYDDLAFHIDGKGLMMYCSLRFYQIEDVYSECKFIEFNACEGELEEDMVNHPKHYTKGGIETLDFILAKANDLPPEEAVLFGHIIRYVTRYRDKFNALEDLNKAEFYLKKLIQIVEGTEE